MDAQTVTTIPSTSTYSETSTIRTGTTGSTLTIELKIQELMKDNSSSPIDLECHIQCERITKILDTAIQKIKLCICVPALVQEQKFEGASIVSQRHLEALLDIFDQYDNPLFSASLMNMAAVEDLKVGDFSVRNRLNPELAHLLYILYCYPKFMPKAEELIEQYREKKDPNYADIMDFLYLMEQFRDLMVNQMETTAAEELSNKILARKLENSNKALLESIAEINKSLETETRAFEETMAVKAEIIGKLDQELTFLQTDATVKLKKKILDSERQMVLATRAHNVRKEVLKEEEIETVEAYENQIKHHLQEEKNLRARRYKVETQLMSWLQKYDLEMSDKQKELDEFSKLYDEEDQQCKELEEKLAEQDKTFIPLMDEREKEYHEEMTEKMNKFLIEHAARVIQTAWRQALANRAEKKKLKKLQKKMQVAAAAAERAREKAAAAAAKAAKAAAKAAKAGRKGK